MLPELDTEFEPKIQPLDWNTPYIIETPYILEADYYNITLGLRISEAGYVYVLCLQISYIDLEGGLAP